MPFSPIVKAKAVEAAAAHCCVCHRFDAGHVEVHHITPQVDGGTDDFENAIALCFDCHAWAGHYNRKHPKGFNYSPAFLRLARDRWYAIVAAGPIAKAPEDVVVQARYLISRDHDVSSRLLAGDLSAAPIKDAMLGNNEFGKFIVEALQWRSYGFRRFPGGQFASIEDFLKAHPNSKCQHSDLGGYAYYDCIRECTQVEFAQWVNEDKLSQVLLDEGADLADLCVVAADNGECGDGSVTEIYLTRPAWVVFLALTNLASRPLAFEQVVGRRDVSEGYRSFETPTAEFAVHMPPCEISAGHTVLIPLALLLGPIEEVGEEQVQTDQVADTGESIEVVSLTKFPHDDRTKFRLFGPSFWPQQVVVRKAGVHCTQGIHQLNMGSVYTLDRVWQCGSCPHLFARCGDADWHYVCELLPDGQGVDVCHSIDLPSDTRELVIAELEDEVSVLTAIALDEEEVGSRVTMYKGDVMQICVSGAKTLSVIGAYYPSRMQVDKSHGAETRNRLICQFLAKMNAQKSCTYRGASTLGRSGADHESRSRNQY